MHEFIIEIVKSDEIYRKIANASLEKKDDIYRYDFMKKFEKKWDMYHCPLKAKQSGGYDVVMASGMLGYLLPQKIGDTEQKYIAELADEKLWTDCVASIESSLMTFVRHGMMTFAKRCSKEILRDPINLGFGLGFPLVLLVLLSAIQANIPVSLFEIDTLTPGITVFGLSFMTLFSATLIAKDRESALLQRLYTTPLTGFDFIMGYMLPLLPIAIGQVLICYLFAIPLGLTVSVNIVYAVIGIIPMAVFNISLGLFCGSVFGVKQVGGICGALLTNLSAWLSGVWFDLELVGGAFEKIANALPFMHAAELEKALFSGNFELAATHILPVLLYGVLITVIAVFCFLRQMKKQ